MCTKRRKHMCAGGAILALAPAAVSVVAGADSATASYPGSNGWLLFDIGGSVYAKGHGPPAGAPKQGVYVIRPDGGRLRLVQAGTSGGGATWSGDGRRIMFVDNRGGPPVALATVDADGGGLRHVALRAVPHSRAPQWPAWSRDDRRIAFVRFGGGEEPRSGLFIADADGTHQRRILGAPKHRLIEQPRWSPDGRRIAFSQGNLGVSVINSDGSARRVIYRNTDPKRFWIGSVDWSPDGRRLVFGLSEQGGGSLVVINSDGSNFTPIANIPSLGESDGVAWSPDGSHIAYSAGDRHGWSVWTVEADGTKPRRVRRFARARTPVRSIDWQATR